MRPGGWTLHYVYDARPEEITRGRGEGTEWKEMKEEKRSRMNTILLLTGRERPVSFVPFRPVTLRALSPRFNAATNSSLTRARNKLARKFELFRGGVVSVAKERKGVKAR